MKQVTRTIIFSIIECAKVEVKDGKIETAPLEPVKVLGSRVKQEKALKYVKDTYGKENTYAVVSIEHKEQLYGMDAEFFMKHAKPIVDEEKKKEEEKEEEKEEKKDVANESSPTEKESDPKATETK
jgi:hypothetical protein